jgi:phosphoribosylaminoimidazole (AIR) synthetase
MIGETAAAAVAKLRADLPDVTSGDLGAAQGAMGVRARGAVIDKNEAEHRHLLLERFTSQNGYSLNRHLVIAPQVLLTLEPHETRAARSQ